MEWVARRCDLGSTKALEVIGVYHETANDFAREQLVKQSEEEEDPECCDFAPLRFAGSPGAAVDWATSFDTVKGEKATCHILHAAKRGPG